VRILRVACMVMSDPPFSSRLVSGRGNVNKALPVRNVAVSCPSRLPSVL
jgi:hypothetical protein